MTTSLENLGINHDFGQESNYTDQDYIKIHEEEFQKEIDNIPDEISKAISFNDSREVRKVFLRENSLNDVQFFSKIHTQWESSNRILSLRKLCEKWYGIEEEEFNNLQDNFVEKLPSMPENWIFMPNEEALKACYLGWISDDYECSTFLEYMEKDSSQLDMKWLDKITELGVEWDKITSTPISTPEPEERPLDV